MDEFANLQERRAVTLCRRLGQVPTKDQPPLLLLIDLALTDRQGDLDGPVSQPELDDKIWEMWNRLASRNPQRLNERIKWWMTNNPTPIPSSKDLGDLKDWTATVVIELMTRAAMHPPPES